MTIKGFPLKPKRVKNEKLIRPKSNLPGADKHWSPLTPTRQQSKAALMAMLKQAVENTK